MVEACLPLVEAHLLSVEACLPLMEILLLLVGAFLPLTAVYLPLVEGHLRFVAGHHSSVEMLLLAIEQTNLARSCKNNIEKHDRDLEM